MFGSFSKNRKIYFLYISFYCTPHFWDRRNDDDNGDGCVSNKWMWNMRKFLLDVMRERKPPDDSKQVYRIQMAARANQHILTLPKLRANVCAQRSTKHTTTPSISHNVRLSSNFCTQFMKKVILLCNPWPWAQKSGNKFVNHLANNVWFFNQMQCTEKIWLEKWFYAIVGLFCPAPITKFQYKFMLDVQAERKYLWNKSETKTKGTRPELKKVNIPVSGCFWLASLLLNGDFFSHKWYGKTIHLILYFYVDRISKQHASFNNIYTHTRTMQKQLLSHSGESFWSLVAVLDFFVSHFWLHGNIMCVCIVQVCIYLHLLNKINVYFVCTAIQS